MRFFARLLVVPLVAVFVACGGGDHGGHEDGAAQDGDALGADGGMNDGGIDGHLQIPDGSIILPDGAIQLPDGAILLADGGIFHPDVTESDGGPTPPDGSILLPDGAWELPDGAIWDPDATTMTATDSGPPPDGSTLLPDGAWELPDGAIWIPDSGTTTMDGGPTPPDGSVLLPDGAWELPDGAIWNPDASLPDGEFYLPDGEIWDGNNHNCPALGDGGPACAPTEICGNGLDDNCDGLVDENCACLPGASERCYNGCRSQAGVGDCTYGTQSCTAGGEIGMYTGHCMGAGSPGPVVCGGFRDYLCDGIIDEGCSCTAGDMRPCYDGPSGTRDVGACQDGRQTCVASDGGTAWGACVGEVLPMAPGCDGIDHACDGMPYEGCACMPGSSRMCYDGPAGTEGVGVCHGGMQSCIASGGMAAWGACEGETTPSPDMCDGIDRLCNGMPNPGCACVAGAMQACYTGPTVTRNVGLCHDGSETCISVGGATMWGPCTGEALPTAEVCDGLDHLCNGMPNTGCACSPGATQSCYDGPPGTSGVGLCHAGMQTCIGGPGGVGSSWGACTGEVTPTSDMCDGVDRECNGMPNAGCTCAPGSTRSCYDGPAGTAGVGQCRSGLQTCNAAGTGYSACTGEVLPGPEVCDGIDHLCNGMPNTGCACTAGMMQSCYSGPAGTSGVGLCRAGTETCVLGPGGVGSSYGPCVGEVDPSPDTCDGVDRQCNGMPYAGCVCMPGATRMCYTGPAGTEGVGLCAPGMQSCISGGSGPMWGPCVGEVLPGPEVCDGLDHLCNGVPDTGCACMPGQMMSCYTGPTGTAGVGTCHAGTMACSCPAGDVGCTWGPCTGEVTPGPIVCDGLDHACDGDYGADCPCVIGAMRSCYGGPPGTAGVGTCHAGNETCAARGGGGTMWGACVGEVDPAAPQCDGLDHACTGMLPDCNPMVTCPAPVATSVSVAVTLTGAATAVAPATITSYAWTVVAQPAGSTYAFTTPTLASTMFTAFNAGVYTVRFTATDSMGRQASCEVLVTVAANSYLGTEFWPVATTNSQIPAAFSFAVAVGNPNATAVTATITGGLSGMTYTFVVPANGTATQLLPWTTGVSHIGATLPLASGLVAGGAYHLTTTAPVSAYEFNGLQYQVGAQYSYTNDASLLLPTVALTSNYMAMAHQSWYTLGDFITIVGTNAAVTTVMVTLAAPIAAGTGVAAAAAGTTQTYMLHQGDVVQLLAAPTLPMGSCTTDPRCGGTCANYCPYDNQDLTGTTITANHPVAVISGHDCSNISGGGNGSCPACDHLEQQMFPLETWGSNYVVSQLQDRGATEPYMVRVMSATAGNTITFTPAVSGPVTLGAGQTTELCLTQDVEVTSTAPVMVGQFMVGQNVTTCTAVVSNTVRDTNGCTTTPSSTSGDPSFVLEVPTAQYRLNYNFVVPASYVSSYINVVAPSGANVTLDTATLLVGGTPLAGTSYVVYRQAIAAGNHNLESSMPFGLKVLGVAPYTSYAYPGGLDLSTL